MEGGGECHRQRYNALLLPTRSLHLTYAYKEFTSSLTSVSGLKIQVQCNDTAKQTSDDTTYLMRHQEEDLTFSSLAYLNLYNITYLLIMKRNSRRPLRHSKFTFTKISNDIMASLSFSKSSKDSMLAPSG
jgi:hypothetical protein